jgi:hypothetical protein
VFRRHADERALPGLQVDPVLRLEAVQAFADRLAADTGLPGKFGFHEVLAGRESAADNKIDECLEDGLP